MPLMTARKLSFMGGLLSDTAITTGQFYSIQSALSTWVSTASQRRMRTAQRCIFSRFSLNVTLNQNISAGATIDFFEVTTQGNITIALGTGTGLFRDLINTDVVPDAGLISVRYTEETLSADIGMGNASMVIVCEILGN